MANCLVENANARDGPQQIAAFVPLDKVQILNDWKVSGLRGSGSNSYIVDDAFVPDCFIAVIRPFNCVQGWWQGRSPASKTADRACCGSLGRHPPSAQRSSPAKPSASDG
jgi:hypothetical protein